MQNLARKGSVFESKFVFIINHLGPLNNKNEKVTYKLYVPARTYYRIIILLSVLIKMTNKLQPITRSIVANIICFDMNSEHLSFFDPRQSDGSDNSKNALMHNALGKSPFTYFENNRPNINIIDRAEYIVFSGTTPKPKKIQLKKSVNVFILRYL